MNFPISFGSQNYDKNVRWLRNVQKEHELSAVNLQPSTDKNGMQNDKIYARKGEIKILIRYSEKHCFDLSVFSMIIFFLVAENQSLQGSNGNLFGASESLLDSILWHY